MIDINDDTSELLVLWPHLAPALERDTGTTETPHVSGGNDSALRLPVNADVLYTIALLNDEIPDLAAWAARTTNQPHRTRTIDQHLRLMPGWHHRMTTTGNPRDAHHLATAIHTLLRHVKLALGLRTPDRPLGQYCPHHDNPLTELIAPGDQAHLHHTSPDTVTITWTKPNAAHCRHCRTTWTPAEYLLLGRALRDADTRRTHHQPTP